MKTCCFGHFELVERSKSKKKSKCAWFSSKTTWFYKVVATLWREAILTNYSHVGLGYNLLISRLHDLIWIHVVLAIWVVGEIHKQFVFGMHLVWLQNSLVLYSCCYFMERGISHQLQSWNWNTWMDLQTYLVLVSLSPTLYRWSLHSVVVLA